jgi:hypothetical protein
MGYLEIAQIVVPLTFQALIESFLVQERVNPFLHWYPIWGHLETAHVVVPLTFQALIESWLVHERVNKYYCVAISA